MTDSEIKNIIRSYMKKRKMSYRKVGDIIGKTDANVHETLNCKCQIRYSTVYDLLQALGLELWITGKDGLSGIRARVIPVEIYQLMDKRGRSTSASFETVSRIADILGYETLVTDENHRPVTAEGDAQ